MCIRDRIKVEDLKDEFFKPLIRQTFEKSGERMTAAQIRHRLRPVSYTHLDVYKRQGVDTLDAVLNASTLPGKRNESERELRLDSVWWRWTL